MKNKYFKAKRLLSVLTAVTFAVTAFPAAAYEDGSGATARAAESVTLQNPRIVEDSSMKAGQKVTWDCVWFGSYPQAEVVTTEMSRNYTAIDKSLLREGDLFVSDSVYSALESASGWDANNDITLGGEKYRRMKKEDATWADEYGYDTYYQWSDSTSWHYFKYEPVKWRVLETDGSQALLLSNIALDGQEYNTECKRVTWETSTVRSWLNGYGAGSNQQGIDHSGKNFLDSAFTAAEQAAIRDSALENADNLKHGTEGGNGTTDKVFLLSESDVYSTDEAAAHGFVKDYNAYDEARRSESSVYAKAMGVGSETRRDTSYVGNCLWWLRSPGDDEYCATIVDSFGWVIYSGDGVVYFSYGVRAALNLNLLSSNLYTYAGTVASDEMSKRGVTAYETAYSTGKKPSVGNFPVTVTQQEKIPGKDAVLTDASGSIYTVAIPGTKGKIGAVTYKAPYSKGIKNATIPAVVEIGGITYKVTAIAVKAFYKCTALKRVTIYGNINKIGKKAFYGCRKLKAIVIKTAKLTKKSVGKNAFKGIYSKALIKVPKKKLKVYKKLLVSKGVGKKAKIRK